MSTQKKPVAGKRTGAANAKTTKAGAPAAEQPKKGGKAGAVKSGAAKAGAAVKAAAKKIEGKTLTIIILSFLLVLTIVISACVCSCYEKRSHGSAGKPAEPQAVAVSADGERMLSTKKYAMPKAMSFLSNARKGVDFATAESYVTVKATLSNEYVNMEYNWDYYFEDESVTDDYAAYYVRVTPESVGADTAKIKCLAAFDKKIVVKVSLKDDATVFDTCTVDCVRDITFSGVEYTAPGDFGGSASVTANFELAKGTVTGVLYCASAEYSLSSAAQEKIRKYLNFDVVFKAYVSAERTVFTLDSTSAVGYTAVFNISEFIEGYADLSAEQKDAVNYAFFAAYSELNKNLPAGTKADNIECKLTLEYAIADNVLSTYDGTDTTFITGAAGAAQVAPDVELDKNGII